VYGETAAGDEGGVEMPAQVDAGSKRHVRYSRRVSAESSVRGPRAATDARALGRLQFRTPDELHVQLEQHAGCALQIEMLDRDESHAYFGIRDPADGSTFYLMARRSEPWLPFRVIKVESEAVAGWLRFTPWQDAAAKDR
jgi:hypothetical protein